MKKRFEAMLLRVAAWILNRNVQRSPYITRKDNNVLFNIEYELRDIADRIEKNYKP
jgi:hypothetical protein